MATVTVTGVLAFRLHISSTSYDEFKAQASQLVDPIIFVRVVSTDDFRIAAVSADTDSFCMSVDGPTGTPKPTTFDADFPVVRYSGGNAVLVSGLTTVL